MTPIPRKTVQTLVGVLATLVFLGLAALSMLPEYELTWPVILACVLIIFALLGKLEELADVLDSWQR